MMFSLLLLASAGLAQDTCPSGDSCFPSPYDGFTCDGVCTQTGGTIECDLDWGSAAYDLMVAISDYDGHGTPSYSIFGGTQNGGVSGATFACFFDNSPSVSSMELGGSSHNDIIELQYQSRPEGPTMTR